MAEKAPPTFRGELAAGVREALGTLPADFCGWALGDWVKHKRELNRLELQRKFDRIATERGLKPDLDAASPMLVLAILETAEEEDRDELQELWAQLLAAAMDPQRAKLVRRSFIETLKQFDPLDARALAALGDYNPNLNQNPAYEIAKKLGVSGDQVVVSLLNLKRLNLVGDVQMHGSVEQGFASVLATGREILRTLSK